MSLTRGSNDPDATSNDPDTTSRPSSMRLMVAFGGLSALLAAGYGVLFTIVDDYREEYGISETAIGFVIGAGFISAFVSQVTIAPLADEGRYQPLATSPVSKMLASPGCVGIARAVEPHGPAPSATNVPVNRPLPS
jgi:MFS family permease